MILILLVAFFVLLVLFGAARIILGWILSKQAMAQVDHVVGAIFKIIFQLSIVGLAGIICYAAYLVWRG